MKKLIVLLNLLFCLSLSATEYIGTLQMASGYTLKDVRVCLDEQVNLTLYHVWTGIGAVGTVLLGILVFREPATFWRMFFTFTLIASIIGLKAVQ